MARLKLLSSTTRTVEYEQYLDRTRLPARIPLYRIVIQLAFAPPAADWQKLPKPKVLKPRSVYAVVDTGSPLSVFHFDTWQPIESEIRWLMPVRKNANARETLTVLGGKWPYRLGRIRIAAFDDAGGWLPPTWTLALFLENSPGCPSINILGLRSPILEHRQLRHSGSDARDIPAWWLEDA